VHVPKKWNWYKGEKEMKKEERRRMKKIENDRKEER